MILGILFCYMDSRNGNRFYLITEPMRDSLRLTRTLCELVEKSEGFPSNAPVPDDNPNKEVIRKALEGIHEIVDNLGQYHPESVLALKNGTFEVPPNVTIIKILYSGYVS